MTDELIDRSGPGRVAAGIAAEVLRPERVAFAGQFAGSAGEDSDKAVVNEWPYPRVAALARRLTSMGRHQTLKSLVQPSSPAHSGDGRADWSKTVCRPIGSKAHASIPLGAGRAVSASGRRPRRYGFGSSWSDQASMRAAVGSTARSRLAQEVTGRRWQLASTSRALATRDRIPDPHP